MMTNGFQYPNGLLLKLVHSSCPHTEYWTWEGDHIHVISDCPYNHPSYAELDTSVEEALAEYALLTNEGWEVEDGRGWHNFIEKWRYYKPSSPESEEEPDFEESQA